MAPARSSSAHADLNGRVSARGGGEAHVVKDFSLDIRAGEFVGLMGQPGCGKSTAPVALMGLVKPPGRIVSGSVSFLGRDLLALDEPELRQVRGKDVGLIVQNPRTSLHPMLKVGTQISNVYRSHNKVGAKRSVERMRSRCCAWSASTIRNGARTRIRTSSRRA